MFEYLRKEIKARVDRLIGAYIYWEGKHLAQLGKQITPVKKLKSKRADDTKIWKSTKS